MKLFRRIIGLTARRKILALTFIGLIILSAVVVIVVVVMDKKTDKTQPLPIDQTTPTQTPSSRQPKTINGVGGVSLPEDPR